MKVIKGSIYIYNANLRELPDLSNVTILGDFDCSSNLLTSLKGFPKQVNGHVNCYDNPVKFSAKDIRAICTVKGRIIADDF